MWLKKAPVFQRMFLVAHRSSGNRKKVLLLKVGQWVISETDIISLIITDWSYLHPIDHQITESVKSKF